MSAIARSINPPAKRKSSSTNQQRHSPDGGICKPLALRAKSAVAALRHCRRRARRRRIRRQRDDIAAICRTPFAAVARGVARGWRHGKRMTRRESSRSPTSSWGISLEGEKKRRNASLPNAHQPPSKHHARKSPSLQKSYALAGRCA